MSYGKTIELFLVNGTTDSITTAELSNWNGKAIKIPRIEVAGCKREDITEPGVYFLFAKDDEGNDSVYIGESENVKERLLQHMRDFDAGRENFEWNTAVIFIGRDLNKALIRYLEDRLAKMARDSKRFVVLTKKTYKNTVLKESQIAAMEEFIDNIRVLINALGYKALEPYIQPYEKNPDEDHDIYYLEASGYKASGRATSEGFVVFSGSTISSSESKSLPRGNKKLREDLMSSAKIRNHTFTEDFLFPSLTSAAECIAGCSISGPGSWKLKDGRSYKEVQKASIGSSAD